MIQVIFNIGYETGAGGGILNAYPYFYYFESTKQFKDFIRDWDFFTDIRKISKDRYVPKRSMLLLLKVIEEVDENYWEWDFKIKMINVKNKESGWTYNDFCDIEEEYFEGMIKSRNRDVKISQILEKE